MSKLRFLPIFLAAASICGFDQAKPVFGLSKKEKQEKTLKREVVRVAAYASQVVIPQLTQKLQQEITYLDKKDKTFKSIREKVIEPKIIDLTTGNDIGIDLGFATDQDKENPLFQVAMASIALAFWENALTLFADPVVTRMSQEDKVDFQAMQKKLKDTKKYAFWAALP